MMKMLAGATLAGAWHPATFGQSTTRSSRAIASGPFEPTWQSLAQYRAPDWVRDAKFGIWAHWTAQCVPEQGDWYVRRMYLQGDTTRPASSTTTSSRCVRRGRGG